MERSAQVDRTPGMEERPRANGGESGRWPEFALDLILIADFWAILFVRTSARLWLIRVVLVVLAWLLAISKGVEAGSHPEPRGIGGALAGLVWLGVAGMLISLTFVSIPG